VRVWRAGFAIASTQNLVAAGAHTGLLLSCQQRPHGMRSRRRPGRAVPVPGTRALVLHADVGGPAPLEVTIQHAARRLTRNRPRFKLALSAAATDGGPEQLGGHPPSVVSAGGHSFRGENHRSALPLRSSSWSTPCRSPLRVVRGPQFSHPSPPHSRGPCRLLLQGVARRSG